MCLSKYIMWMQMYCIMYVYCMWGCRQCNELWLSRWQCLKRGSNNTSRMHMSQSMRGSALLLWSVVSLWVSVSEECILWFWKMTYRAKCLVKKRWWRQSSSSCRVLTFTVSHLKSECVCQWNLMAPSAVWMALPCGLCKCCQSTGKLEDSAAVNPSYNCIQTNCIS